MYVEKNVEAFIQKINNEDFQKELKRIRNNLSYIFIDLIEFIKSEKLISEEQLIISTPEARVKSLKSLKEKIIRNNYYDEWKIREGLSFDDCKQIVLDKLPDLIGLRINCYFFEDEEKLFKLILEDEKVISFLKEKQITLESDQKGKIFKYNGRYTEESKT